MGAVPAPEQNANQRFDPSADGVPIGGYVVAVDGFGPHNRR
jgi:hypothetical protein